MFCCLHLDLWKHFSRIRCAADNKNVDGFIVCNQCKKVFKYTSTGGTTNILSHIEKHQQPNQTNQIDQFFAPVKNFQLSIADKEVLVDASVNFVCKDLRPYLALEGEGMLDFAQCIWNMGAKLGMKSRDEIRSALPSAVTVSRNVKKNAEKKKNEMRTILSKMITCCLFMGVTCDIWMDDYRRISYMALTIHFYTNVMNLCDQVISIVPLDITKRKSASYIKDVIKQSLQSNNIPFDNEKLVFVTDRGANIKKALENFYRLNCFPHFINNTVQEACKIDIIAKAIKQCAELVRYFKISGLNNELKVSLKSVVKTRFNYVLATIESILINWNQITEILNRENELNRIDGLNTELLKHVSNFLSPFKQWSDHSEKSKSPSLSYVWIAIDALIKHCAVKDDDDHLVTLMKVKALGYIEKRFVLHKFHRISTFLNPNFKCLKFASTALYEKTLSDTREMVAMIPEQANPSVTRRDSRSSASTIESELSNYCDNIADDNDEIGAYIRFNHFTDLKLDPGRWWFNHVIDFPKLSKLAIAIHGIPASSTPSERAFSTSGAIITDRRVYLSPASIEDIIILRSDAEKFMKNNIWG